MSVLINDWFGWLVMFVETEAHGLWFKDNNV